MTKKQLDVEELLFRTAGFRACKCKLACNVPNTRRSLPLELCFGSRSYCNEMQLLRSIKPKVTAIVIRCTDLATLYQQEVCTISAGRGGPSVAIFPLRTKSHKVRFVLFDTTFWPSALRPLVCVILATSAVVKRHCSVLFVWQQHMGSRDGAVGIAVGYGLDGRRVKIGPQ
jgi:hypothetical protein